MSLPLLHAGRTNPGLSAALDLRFALDKSLTAYRGPTPSFSRASTGSYFDGSGVLRYAPLNYLTYSEDLTDGSWVKNNSSISANSAISPDGKQTADKIVENTASSTSHRVYHAISVPSPATFSAYFKPAGRNFVRVILYPGITIGAYFDLINGTVISSDAGITGQISSAGNGWFRCSVTYTGGATSVWAQVHLSPDGITDGYTGDGSSGIYMWGAQVEASSTVGTYCPTTNAANSAPRFNHTFNGTSWVSRGLLVEEQRTNVMTNSQAFGSWSAQSGCTAVSNNAAGIDGGTTASTLNEGSLGTDYKGVYIFATLGSGAQTFSLYAKSVTLRYLALHSYFDGSNYCGAIFDLVAGTCTATTALGNWSSVSGSVVDCANGWYRISMTATSAGSLTPTWAIRPANAGTGFTPTYGAPATYTGTNRTASIFGAQAELGAFPTSYIPATTATTRSADVCQITGGDFSGFYNASEGSIAVDFDRLYVPSSGSALFSIRDAGNNNAIYSYISGSQDQSEIYTSGVVATFNFGTPSSINILSKISTAYKVNDFAGSRNGSTALTDSSGAVPVSPTYMVIGDTSGSSYLNGHIARLRYYRKRLPNETLQLLSDPDPTLNLQFALNKTLTPVSGPAPSFSRASTGSYFDSTGTLKYANVNLITWSEDFTQSAWNGGSTGRTPNTITAPDGTLTADTLSFNGGSQIYHATTGSSAVQTFSSYVKKIDHRYVSMQIETGASAYRAVFDLDTASVTDTNASTTASIISVGNGWYRCSVTNTSTASSILWFTIQQSATATFSTGVGLKQFYVWGAQAEFGSSASQYAKTIGSTTAGPRFDHVYSGGQWVSRGLLVEEQRTNLAQRSEDFGNAYYSKSDSSISANQIAAPDGATTADKLVENTANAIHYFSSSGYMTTNQTYACSIFVKAAERNWIKVYIWNGSTSLGAWFNLSSGTIGTTESGITSSIQNVGNGWYRCSITRAVSSGLIENGFGVILATADNSVTYTGDGSSGVYVWGSQVEAGSFSTSYIGTTTSSVTRSADVCQITGTSFNWMWNQGEGSVVAEYDRIASASVISGGFPFVWESYSDSNNKMSFLVESTGKETFYGAQSGATNWSIDNSVTFPANTAGKVAGAYKVNDIAVSTNGSSVATDGTANIPVTSSIVIGNRGSGSNLYLNGHIAKLIYYPARLTNIKLQQLST